MIKEKEKWTEEEEDLLYELFFEYGSKWKSMLVKLRNKNDNSLKNKFYSTIRTGIRKLNSFISNIKRKQRGRQSRNYKLVKPEFLNKIVAVSDGKFSNKIEAKPTAAHLSNKILKQLIDLARSDKKFTPQDFNKDYSEEHDLFQSVCDFNRNCRKKKKGKIRVKKSKKKEQCSSQQEEEEQQQQSEIIQEEMLELKNEEIDKVEQEIPKINIKPEQKVESNYGSSQTMTNMQPIYIPTENYYRFHDNMFFQNPNLSDSSHFNDSFRSNSMYSRRSGSKTFALRSFSGGSMYVSSQIDCSRHLFKFMPPNNQIPPHHCLDNSLVVSQYVNQSGAIKNPQLKQLKPKEEVQQKQIDFLKSIRREKELKVSYPTNQLNPNITQFFTSSTFFNVLPPKQQKNEQLSASHNLFKKEKQ